MHVSVPMPISIPGYEIVGLIHHGAQGMVYEAVHRATRRTVAVKVCAGGAPASAASRARFQREVELLASIRHPNIVSVYDSGTVNGAFYFAMDHVRGRRLDEYLSSSAQNVRQRVELFAGICEAVSAAHLHGVIHRDLKPGNILIDAQGRPHIVDFGLAKLAPALGPAAPALEVSRTGEFLGSLPWASPEQAEPDSSRIDMRTDVYSLGVVLYQMLTGHFPYPVTGNMRDVLDRIVHAEPTPPRSLFPELDQDLETIVLKALSKSPQRRYQSAGELAGDVRSFLAGDAIAARRDSTLYVLRKKLWRHRGRVAAALAFLVLVMAFGVGLIAIRRQLAGAERRAIDIQLAFMEKALVAVDPGNPGGRDLSELESIAARIDSELAAYPAIQGRLMERIGNIFRRMGLLDAAGPYLRRSVEIQRVNARRPNAELASSLHSLAALRWDQGDYDAAETLYREAMAIRADVFGGAHPLVADTMNELAASLSAQAKYTAAQELYRRVLDLRLRLLGEEHADVAGTRNNLASCLMETGEYAEAEDLYRRALAEMKETSDSPGLVGAERPQYLARVMTSLAACLVERDKLDEAEPMLRGALDKKREMLGPNHPSVALSLHWLARLAYERRDWPAAETLAREALAIRSAALPDRHPHTAISMSLLGAILCEAGRHAEAEQLLSHALEIQRQKLPVPSWRTAHTALCLAVTQMQQQRYAEAGPLLAQSLATLRQTRGDDDRYTQEALERAIQLHEAVGNPARAEEYRSLVRPPRRAADP